MADPAAGFAALEERFELRPVQPLTSCCRIGNRRTTVAKDGFRVETFSPQYAPPDTVRGQFEFGLKYDDLNLEWLSRFFSAVDPGWVLEWLESSPTSAYARRTGFLYEWLTRRRLPVGDTRAPAYDDAVDPARYFTAHQPVKNRRWRINDNLPGTADFCPLVRLTQEVIDATRFDVTASLQALDDRFGADLLLRSAAWLTFAESRATFAIEKEADRKQDIKRFAAAMATHCGRLDAPLSDDGLAVLQKDVLGDRALRIGLRKSPVFVGSAAHHDATVVRYIAPDWIQVPGMMTGLRAFDERTRPVRGAELGMQERSIVRAAALAFGFVYIHPMSDGNGRIHRLLVNDTLMRDGVVPAGIILPISSTILGSSRLRGEYERVLDSFSARQLRRYATDYRFGRTRLCDDGVETDFEFDAYEDAGHAWRYPDLTAHTAYLAAVLRLTVEDNMTNEASFLARHDEAKQRLKRAFEMPDVDADAIIRSLRENNGRVSRQLMQRYTQVFDDPFTAAEVLEAVMSGLEGRDEEVVAPPGRAP